MLTRRFKWDDQSDFGTGWTPAWMEGADPVQGRGAAHDVLEHFPRCIGGLEGEMMAFGAMHYIRGEQSGFYWGKHGIYRNQASDIEHFLRNRAWSDGVPLVREPGKVRMEADSIHHEELRLQVRKAIYNVFTESGSGGYTRQECRAALPRGTDERIMGWIYKGYHKAEKRFAQWNLKPWDCANLFRKVQERFDRTAKWAEESMQITVRVDFRQRFVSVDADYPRGW